MMKKILLLLLSVLTFTCCTDTYRSDDFFIVMSKEKGNTTSYKYLYGVNHYMTSTKEGSFFLGDCIFASNENYELGDTIKFTRYISNEK